MSFEKPDTNNNNEGDNIEGQEEREGRFWRGAAAMSVAAAVMVTKYGNEILPIPPFVGGRFNEKDRKAIEERGFVQVAIEKAKVYSELFEEVDARGGGIGGFVEAILNRNKERKIP